MGLIDIMPTICRILKVEHPSPAKLDGIDLSPLFYQRSIERAQPLSWFFYRTTPEMAMRIENHVLLGKSNDTIGLTHPLTQPAMDYIKNMKLNAFEIYDLRKDIGQNHNLFSNFGDSIRYKKIIIERLSEIQKSGPYWENLPKADISKKQKHEWRDLRPTGFSN